MIKHLTSSHMNPEHWALLRFRAAGFGQSCSCLIIRQRGKVCVVEFQPSPKLSDYMLMSQPMLCFLACHDNARGAHDTIWMMTACFAYCHDNNPKPFFGWHSLVEFRLKDPWVRQKWWVKEYDDPNISCGDVLCVTDPPCPPPCAPPYPPFCPWHGLIYC